MAEQTLSDLIAPRRNLPPADRAVGALRAIGQGAGLGWSDEAEAYARARAGVNDYDAQLKRIRGEYGQYYSENPKTAFALEMLGGAAPMAATALVPGMQPAAVTQGAGALAKLAAAAAVTGAISGAGSAEQDRTSGAIAGGVLGGAFGAGAPLMLRGAGAGWRWLMERLNPTETRISTRAAGKLSEALNQTGLTPQMIERKILEDRAMGVPSVVANVSPATADLAQAVAQRTGAGARKIEDKLHQQLVGSRERTHQQVVKGLNPGDFYADEQKLLEQLRSKAGTVYDNAYAVGEVNDPRINEVLKNPQFKAFFDKARKIADTEAQAAKLRGEDPSKFALPDLYKLELNPVTQELTPVVSKLPDVRTLDYIKRGIDATIDSGFRGQGMSTAEANALKQLRNQFVNAIDENVPEYALARKTYGGDMEVLDAIRAGMNDFGKMDHEQVMNLVSKMSQAEKEAFRTGVSRDIYGRIMGSSNNLNAAHRVIGSPEMQAKLQPLFDSPSQFNLFKAALERESQLYGQAGKILGGSSTAKNLQMREALDAGEGVGEVVAGAVTGGIRGSLSMMVTRAISSGKVSDKTAEKLGEMLMSKDPNEVAAVVRLLEKYQSDAVPKAIRGTAIERGVVGSQAAFPSAPQSADTMVDESQSPAQPAELSLIERDIAAEKTPAKPELSLIEQDIQREESKR